MDSKDLIIAALLATLVIGGLISLNERQREKKFCLEVITKFMPETEAIDYEQGAALTEQKIDKAGKHE